MLLHQLNLHNRLEQLQYLKQHSHLQKFLFTAFFGSTECKENRNVFLKLPEAL